MHILTDKVHTLFFLYTVGKFPHLVASVPGPKKTSDQTSANEAVLNFGEVPVQSTSSKWIELHNFSPVSSFFSESVPC